MRKITSRRTVSAMTKTLGVAITAGALVLTGAAATVATADSRDKNVHCKILSTSTDTRVRDISGVVMGVKWVDGKRTYLYGHGDQMQTVTTTKQRCRGKVATKTVVSPWTGGSIY